MDQTLQQIQKVEDQAKNGGLVLDPDDQRVLNQFKTSIGQAQKTLESLIVKNLEAVKAAKTQQPAADTAAQAGGQMVQPPAGQSQGQTAPPGATGGTTL